MAKRNGFISTQSGGFRAWVRVGQTLKTKCFPKGTSVEDVQQWRETMRQTIRSSPAQRFYALANGRWGKGLRINRVPRAEHGWCYVYFVASGGFVKIGSAIDIRQRLCALRTNSPEKLILLAVVPAHRDLEMILHRHFWRDRTRAEWYRLSDEMRAFIDKVKAGWNPLLVLMGEAEAAVLVDESGQSPAVQEHAHA